MKFFLDLGLPTYNSDQDQVDPILRPVQVAGLETHLGGVHHPNVVSRFISALSRIGFFPLHNQSYQSALKFLQCQLRRKLPNCPSFIDWYDLWDPIARRACWGKNAVPNHMIFVGWVCGFYSSQTIQISFLWWRKPCVDQRLTRSRL